MTSNVSALFINDLVAAITLSVFHKPEVSLVLVFDSCKSDEKNIGKIFWRFEVFEIEF